MFIGEPATPQTVREIYCDASILVIDKPAGLPMHPSNRYLHGTVVGRLRTQYGENFAAAVHRLDRETSGVVVCARHREAARAMGFAFERGQVRKEYLTVVEGTAPEAAFTVDAPIAVGGAVVRIATRVDFEAGKPASTHFVREQSFTRDGLPFEVLRAFPKTGRRHQVRLHVQHAGMRVVGDKIYGHDENFYVRFCELTLQPADWARLRLPRHALHAAAIEFPHPADGRPMRFEAPLPDDLRCFVSP